MHSASAYHSLVFAVAGLGAFTSSLSQGSVCMSHKCAVWIWDCSCFSVCCVLCLLCGCSCLYMCKCIRIGKYRFVSGRGGLCLSLYCQVYIGWNRRQDTPRHCCGFHCHRSCVSVGGQLFSDHTSSQYQFNHTGIGSGNLLLLLCSKLCTLVHSFKYGPAPQNCG